MTHKRHQGHKPPSLDPDSQEPVAAAAPPEDEGSLPPPPPATGPSEVDVWRDRHLRLAAEYDNFRKRTTKERAEVWSRAQAELVSRLAGALDDFSRFPPLHPAEIHSKTL